MYGCDLWKGGEQGTKRAEVRRLIHLHTEVILGAGGTYGGVGGLGAPSECEGVPVRPEVIVMRSWRGHAAWL